MSDKPNRSFKERLLDDICDDIAELEGVELDDFLRDAGIDPTTLMQRHRNSLEVTAKLLKRSRFEEARDFIRNKGTELSSKITTLDYAKKLKILASIEANVPAMTVAGRNKKGSTENDVDSYLEACVHLGVIDEDGNLKS